MATLYAGNKGKRRGFGRIELRDSGRYRVGYTAPDGKLYRAPSTFDSKDDAIAWLAARRAEIQLKVWAPDIVERSVARKAVPTFQDYAKRWLSTRKTQGHPLRPTTRDHYQYLLDSALYPTFGKTPIDEISVEDVNDWYEKVAPGRESQRAHAYSLLRTILGTAASTRPKPLIAFNPAHIRGAGNVKPVHKVRPATLQELEVVVKNLPDRYRLMALLAAWCAMRFGELAELRRGDIDLKQQASRDPSRSRARAPASSSLVFRRPTQGSGTSRSRHTSSLLSSTIWRRTSGPSLTPCSSPRRRTRNDTCSRRRSTRSTTRRARPPAARTSAGTTSATPARCSPPRPAPPLPS